MLRAEVSGGYRQRVRAVAAIRDLCGERLVKRVEKQSSRRCRLATCRVAVALADE